LSTTTIVCACASPLNIVEIEKIEFFDLKKHRKLLSMMSQIVKSVVVVISFWCVFWGVLTTKVSVINFID